MFFFFQTQKIGSQTNIPKIQFGCFDQPFGNVGMPGRELEGDVAGL
jgi:hypothetical protein